MSDLKSWQEFYIEEQLKPEGTEVTAIACPCCGKALYKDVSVVLTSLPPKYKYFCNSCGWFGFA